MQTSKTSKDQDEKIAIIRVRERNLAQLLNQTREEVVGLKTQNRDQAKRIDQLEQTVAALQNSSGSGTPQLKIRAQGMTGLTILVVSVLSHSQSTDSPALTSAFSACIAVFSTSRAESAGLAGSCSAASWRQTIF